jgi:hypothetical protein
MTTLLTVRKSTRGCAHGKASASATTGVQERGMVQEKRQELARPHCLPFRRGADANHSEAAVTGTGESDGLIVLCDGSADHMGKGAAKWWNRTRDQGSDA